MVKTQEVLVEICPQCNTLHRYHVDHGVMREVGASELVCNGVLGYKQVPRKQNETKGKAAKPIPILCDHKILPSDHNIFTIKRWSFRQRREFYKQSRLFDTQGGGGRLDPDIMVYVLLNGVAKAPFEMSTQQDIDNADVDGALLEGLHGMIMDFNTPPLSRSSASRQQSTPRTPASSPTTT